MKRDMSELFEKARSFVLDIENGEKLFLFSHNDTDGITSALIFKKCLERLGKGISKFFTLKIEDSERLFSELMNCKKAIVLDLPFDKYKKRFLSSKKEILFVDHHTVNEDVNSEKIIYMNPRLEKPETYQPVAYLSYKIFSHLVDVKKIWLVAVMGTIADYGFEDCKDLFSDLNVGSREELWKTEYGRIVEKIYAAESVLGPDKIFVLLDSSQPTVKHLPRSTRL